MPKIEPARALLDPQEETFCINSRHLRLYLRRLPSAASFRGPVLYLHGPTVLSGHARLSIRSCRRDPLFPDLWNLARQVELSAHPRITMSDDQDEDRLDLTQWIGVDRAPMVKFSPVLSVKTASSSGGAEIA